MMKSIKCKSMLVVSSLLLATFNLPAITVHTIGDSTMCHYSDKSKRGGWADYLSESFADTTIHVANHGRSGRSTKSFYQQGLWAKAKATMQPGDYLIIQFGHNDEKSNGADGDSLKAYYEAKGDTEQLKKVNRIGTSPKESYKVWLRKFITEAREKKVVPILMSSVCRINFAGDTLSLESQHNLAEHYTTLRKGILETDKKLPTSDHSMDYVQAMKEVAAEMNVPFVNMTQPTKEFYNQIGYEKAKNLYFKGTDKTHTAKAGAKMIAKMAAKELQKASLMPECWKQKK